MIPTLPRSSLSRHVAAAYMLAFFAFLFLPLAIVAVFAFNDANYPAPPWRGFTLEWLPIDQAGHVQPCPPRGETRLVCVQLANHEMGAIQPIAELMGEVPYSHCDAAQAVGKMPVRFHELGVTALSLSAHKFHGPKGIGALLARRGCRLQPLLHGGHHQQGRRPGTERKSEWAGPGRTARKMAPPARWRRSRRLR